MVSSKPNPSQGNLPFYTPLSRVQRVIGISRSTALRREEDDPSFPQRRRLGPARAAQTAYVTEELLAWAASRERVG